jgi:O-antigen ligase
MVLWIFPYIFILALVGTEGMALHLVRIWVLGAAANGVLSVTDLLGLTSVSSSLLDQEYGLRVAGLTIHPNHLGLSILLALPGALMCIKHSSVLGRILWTLASVMVLSGILLSGSRACLVAVVGIFLFYFFYGRPLKHTLKRLAASVVLFSVLAFFVYYTNVNFQNSATESQSAEIAQSAAYGFLRLVGAESVGESDEERIRMYREALDGFMTSPLIGDGYSHVRTAHDIYLQLLQSGGLLGTFGFLVFCGGVFVSAHRSCRDLPTGQPLRDIVVAMVVAMATWLLVGLVFNLIQDRFLYIPAAIILAVAYRESRGKVLSAMPLKE